MHERTRGKGVDGREEKKTGNVHPQPHATCPCVIDRLAIRQQHQPYRVTNPMAMFWFWFADMSLALDRAIARLQGQGRHRVARALLVYAEKEPHPSLSVTGGRRLRRFGDRIRIGSRCQTQEKCRGNLFRLYVLGAPRLLCRHASMCVCARAPAEPQERRRSCVLLIFLAQLPILGAERLLSGAPAIRL